MFLDGVEQVRFEFLGRPRPFHLVKAILLLKMNSKVLICVVLASIVGSCIAATCSKPEIKSTSFTTQDATIVSQIAFITEFELKCSNAGGENLPLFAEVNGRLSPVARTGSGKYQVCY